MELNHTYSWYTTEFHVPLGFAQRGHAVKLNFEAVDYQATVYVNDQLVGTHEGGYWHFGFDITKFINTNGTTNTLHVNVFDPTDQPGMVLKKHLFMYLSPTLTDNTLGYMHPVGKQASEPSHIFYTPCSGIWQSVSTCISGVLSLDQFS